MYKKYVFEASNKPMICYTAHCYLFIFALITKNEEKEKKSSKV